MKKFLVGIVFLASAVSVKAQYVSLSDAEIGTLKKAIQADGRVKRTFEPFKTAAEKALTESPNPIEKITSQGLLQGNPAKTASLKAVDDAAKIYALALHYRLYGKKPYLDKALEFLTAWATINKASGGPIDETKLEDLIAGYDLIRSQASNEQKKQIDTWLNSIAEAEINSESVKNGRSTAVNNWNSHRIKVITLITYTTHADMYKKTIINELEKQLAQNLNPDGSSYDFYQRDALHYHIYTLEPLLKAIITLNRAEGKNYYVFQSKNKSSIEKSVKFLVPFVSGDSTHQEFLNSKVKFDRDRANNNEKGYIPGASFAPRNGIIVLSLACYFNPSYLDVIKKAAKNGQDYYDWQLVLNQVRKKS